MSLRIGRRAITAFESAVVAMLAGGMLNTLVARFVCLYVGDFAVDLNRTAAGGVQDNCR